MMTSRMHVTRWLVHTALLVTLQAWCISSQDNVPDINTLPYVFESESLPRIGPNVNERYLPSVGNGHLATNVLTDTIFVNNFYNGNEEVEGSSFSQRARVQSVHSSDFTIDGSTTNVTHRYRLDVIRAIFEHDISTDVATVTYRVYAHHYYNRLLITDVTIRRQPGYDDVINVTRLPLEGDESIDLNNDPPLAYNGSADLIYQYGTIKIPETSSSGNTPMHMYWTAIPDSFSLAVGSDVASWTFVTSLDQDNRTAELHFQQGLTYVAAGTTEDLLRIHTDSWSEVWSMGSIEVDGDLNLYKVIYGSLYYIYSSLPSHRTFTPSNPFGGLSPGGLPNGDEDEDFLGHVFWDMETWVYPPILMLRPDLALDMQSYRINRMPPAFQRAASGGYLGTRFPWESAYTGAEVCPSGFIGRETQQHITGDIAFAARQYISATRDVNWLTSRQPTNQYSGFDFILEMGRFWYSRPTYNSTEEKYEINGIMPPDEYAEQVNNSVYTNIMASYSVHFARYAACLSGLDPEVLVPDSWLNIVQNLAFPYQAVKRYHEEYEGYDEQYNNLTQIKQADVVLLGFPLLWSMPDDVRANDLDHYARVTDPFGPAMTWSMYSVGWLDVGDKVKADDMFNKSYQNYVTQPFKVWSENRFGGGAVNFITGMGGFLQALMFGYAGMRLHVEELSFQSPQLPPSVTRFAFRHVNYLGNVLDFTVRQGEINVHVVSDNIDEFPLVLVIGDQTSTWDLTTGFSITVFTPFRIYTSRASGCPLPEDKIVVDYTPV